MNQTKDRAEYRSGLNWFALGGSGETHILNKVADNGIVEIFDVGPLDAL